MTPLGFECEHVCCVDEGPHAHLMNPEECGDCKQLRPSERASELVRRTLQIGSPDPDKKENNNG